MFNECSQLTSIDISSLINTNITALHILTKEVLKKMEKQNSGHILNIASSAAACSSGPLMATYYASKSYVYVLSRSIYYELKKNNSNVKISVALPGPVDTNFNKNLNISFSVKPLSSMYVAETCVNKMFKDKFKIVPGFKNKCGVFLSRLLPEFLVDKYIFNMQKKKLK